MQVFYLGTTLIINKLQILKHPLNKGMLPYHTVKHISHSQDLTRIIRLHFTSSKLDSTSKMQLQKDDSRNKDMHCIDCNLLMSSTGCNTVPTVCRWVQSFTPLFAPQCDLVSPAHRKRCRRFLRFSLQDCRRSPHANRSELVLCSGKLKGINLYRHLFSLPRYAVFNFFVQAKSVRLITFPLLRKKC